MSIISLKNDVAKLTLDVQSASQGQTQIHKDGKALHARVAALEDGGIALTHTNKQTKRIYFLQGSVLLLILLNSFMVYSLFY